MAWDKEVEAFTKQEKHMLDLAITNTAHQQLASVLDVYSADELRLLFIPEEHRSALSKAFQLHAVDMTSNEIFLQANHLLPNLHHNIFDDPAAHVRVVNMLLYVSFDRNTLADGFITPTPICGTLASPVVNLAGAPPAELRERFIHMLGEMSRIAGEWATVRWVLNQLNKHMRTPAQVRYHWPPIQTLAAAADIAQLSSLQKASVRAGTNSAVPTYLRPYLRPTYEVVSNAVLMKFDSVEITRYRAGQMRWIRAAFQVIGENDGLDPINVE